MNNQSITKEELINLFNELDIKDGQRILKHALEVWDEEESKKKHKRNIFKFK